MGRHSTHRKHAVAEKVNKQRKIYRWLVKLDKIFISLEMERRNK